MQQITTTDDIRAMLPPQITAFIDTFPIHEIVEAGGLSPRFSDDLMAALKPITAPVFDMIEAVEGELADTVAAAFGMNDETKASEIFGAVQKARPGLWKVAAEANSLATRLHEYAGEYGARRAMAA